MADWKNYRVKFALKKSKTEKDIFKALEYEEDSIKDALMSALDLDEESDFELASSSEETGYEMEYGGYGDTADFNLEEFIESIEGITDGIEVRVRFPDGDESVQKYGGKVSEKDRVKNLMRDNSILDINVDFILFILDEIFNGSAGMALTDEEMERFKNADTKDLVNAMEYQWNNEENKEFHDALTAMVIAIARRTIS